MRLQRTMLPMASTIRTVVTVVPVTTELAEGVSHPGMLGMYTTKPHIKHIVKVIVSGQKPEQIQASYRKYLKLRRELSSFRLYCRLYCLILLNGPLMLLPTLLPHLPHLDP